MRSLPVLVRVYLSFVLFSLGGTALQVFGGLDPGPIAPVAAVLTLALGVVAVIARALAGLRAALFVFCLGIVVEVCGLYTGLPFGRYRYSDAWWPSIPLPSDQLFPVMLPFAWVLIVVGATLALSRWLAGIRLALAAGLVASAIDFFKEPVLTQVLGYWKWTDPSWPLGEGPFGVPLLNALGWFVVATLGAWIYEAVRHSPLLRPGALASDSLGGGAGVIPTEEESKHGQTASEAARYDGVICHFDSSSVGMTSHDSQCPAVDQAERARAATAVLAGHVLLMSGIGAMRGFPWMVVISVLAIAVIGWSAHRTPGPLVESQR